MYQTGIANNVNDFLDKLKLYAETIGWTIHRHEVANINGGTSNGVWLQISNADTGCFSFYSDSRVESETSNRHAYPKPQIYVAGETGSGDSDLIWEQPGSTAKDSAMTNGLYGPFTYFLFGSNQYIHCIIEIRPGLFAHLGAGMLEKSGYDGGQYIFGTKHYCDIDSTNSNHGGNWTMSSHCWPFDSRGSSSVSTLIRLGSNWLKIGSSNSTKGYGWGPIRADKAIYNNNGDRSPIGWLFDASPNTLNSITPLFPLLTYAQDFQERGLLLGSPCDMRWCNIKNIVPGESIFIGQDEWVIFPIKAKVPEGNAPQGQYSSYLYGLAYKKL